MNLAQTIVNVLIEDEELRRLARVGLPMMDANKIIRDTLDQFGKVTVLKQYKNLTQNLKKGRHYDVEILISDSLLQEVSAERKVPEWHWYVRRRIEYMINSALHGMKIPGMDTTAGIIDYYPDLKTAKAGFTVSKRH